MIAAVSYVFSFRFAVPMQSIESKSGDILRDKAVALIFPLMRLMWDKAKKEKGGKRMQRDRE